MKLTALVHAYSAVSQGLREIDIDPEEITNAKPVKLNVNAPHTVGIRLRYKSGLSEVVLPSEDALKLAAQFVK